MPVRIGRFQPTSMERVEELRRSKVRTTGDPGMVELLDAVESGEPQEVPVEGEQSPKGLRIAISRAANRRGLTVEMHEGTDTEGKPVVVVVKGEPVAKARQAQPSGNGRRKGRPKKPLETQATDNYTESRDDEGMSETME